MPLAVSSCSVADDPLSSWFVADDPLHVHSDAADLLPHHDSDFMVVEISDGSRHSVVAIARAMSKVSLPYLLLCSNAAKLMRHIVFIGWAGNLLGRSMDPPMVNVLFV